MYRVRKRCLMTDIDSLASGKPVPPVNADDLKRVWYAIRDMTGVGQTTEDHVPGRTVGISTRLLEPHCESGADVTAVSVTVVSAGSASRKAGWIPTAAARSQATFRMNKTVRAECSSFPIGRAFRRRRCSSIAARHICYRTNWREGWRPRPARKSRRSEVRNGQSCSMARATYTQSHKDIW